jgi:branched-chain amino acid transport system permease protein
LKFWGIRIGSVFLAVFGCLALEAICGKVTNDYGQRLVFLAGLYVTLAVSLNLINGITGQFSIGHAAFYQIGAYSTAAITDRYFQQLGLPLMVWLFLMMVVGALFAAIAGFVVGLPSLRLRGDYLAIVTLGFGEIIRIQVNNVDALGGAYGLTINAKIGHLWVVWLLAICCIALCRNLLKTAHGLPFLAVREDEVASLAMGVDVTRVKVTAFVIGSAFAGAAGALLAHYEGFITPGTFSMDVSFIILTMVVLGGSGSVTGSAVAAIFLSYLPEYLRSLKGADGGDLQVSHASVIAGLVAVVLVLALSRKLMLLNRKGKGYLYASILVLAVVIKVFFQAVMSRFGNLGDPNITTGQLRMVIFSVTLIVVMLLRPQGMLAHYEWSWDHFRKRRPSNQVND